MVLLQHSVALTPGFSKHIVVVGAGIVGAMVALALLRDGHRVTLIEPGEPGGEQAASFGNGAWLSPASVVPMSTPGLWKRLPGYLSDRSGPLVIRWPTPPTPMRSCEQLSLLPGH